VSSCRYKIIDQFLQGTASTIYKAVDILSGDVVCIKKLSSTSNYNQQEIFKRNFRNMAESMHSLLMPVLDYGVFQGSGSPFYTMPWVEHVPFKDKQWDLNDLVKLYIQVTQALVYLHRKGCRFSKLNSSNILWLKHPDDEGKQIRLINYFDTGVDRPFSTDLHRMAFIIIDCLEKYSGLNDTDTGKFVELRGLNKLKTLCNDVILMNPDLGTAWNLLLKLIELFDTQQYSRRPSRRIYFAESPFLGQDSTIEKLDNWLSNTAADSALIFESLTLMGRHRLVRNWLARIKPAGINVIELNLQTAKPVLRYLAGETETGLSADAVTCLDQLRSTLLIVHRNSTIELLDKKWIAVIKEVTRRGWQILISADEQRLFELEEEGILDCGYVSHISMPPISYADSCRIVTMLLGSKLLSPRLQHETHKLARGNPGLIVKVINFWIREDFLIKEKDQWILTPDTGIPLPVPPEIQRILKNRLTSLSPDVVQFLHVFALLDKVLDAQELAAFVEISDLKRILKLLVYRDIITVENRANAEFGYTFSHKIFKVTILDQMNDEQKRNGHRKIAIVMERDAWEASDIAYHWLEAGEIEKGVRKGLEVAWGYRYKGEFIKAEKWVNKLRAKTTGLPVKLQADVYYLHTEISLMRYRHHDVLESAHRALDLLPQTRDFSEIRSFLYQHIGQVQMREAHFEDAQISVARGLKEIEKLTPGQTSITLGILAGAIARFRGDYVQAQGELEKAESRLEYIKNISSKQSSRATIMNLKSSILIDKGFTVEARAILDECIKLCDECGFNYYRALLRNKRAWLESLSGYSSVADVFLSEATRISQKLNLLSEIAHSDRISGMIALQRSQFVDAETFINRSVNMSKQLCRKLDEPFSSCLMAGLYRKQGRYAEAREIITDLLNEMQNRTLYSVDLKIFIEAAFLELDNAKYTAALRFFNKGLKLVQLFSGHRDDAWIRYGMALVYWRLNHLERTRANLKQAEVAAASSDNQILLAWIFLLKARLEKLDRNRLAFVESLDKSEKLFAASQSEQGRLSIVELRLRDSIDKDLSDEKWKKAIDLWSTVRNVDSWRQLLDIAITVSRLGIRRGNYNQITGLIDSMIGLSRENNCREELWRLFRIRAKLQENQGFSASARESLISALSIIKDISRDIRSPILNRSYNSRYDVRDIRNQIKQINRKEKISSSRAALPSLSFNEESSGKRVFMFTSEHNRLLRQSVRRFRQHLEAKDLVTDLMDVSLKLSGGDRSIVFLRQPGQDIYEQCGIRLIGLAPEVDSRVVRTSSLFENIISEKQFFYSPNISTDDRIAEMTIKKHVGKRSVLVTPMRAARDVVGVIYLDSRVGSNEMLIGTAPVVQELADEAALSLEISTLYRDLDDTFMSMVRALGSAVDAKDKYTHGHSSRVAEYALLIGHELGLRIEDIRDLEIGAYLHDIGKIGIAKLILESQDKLSDEEMEEIRHHPEIGTRILSPVRKLAKVALAIRQHHERYDGKGYPDQLKGEDILLIARIISVADALDAMTTIRPYHNPMPLKKCIKVIVDNAGAQFDPLVAGAVKQLFHKGLLKLT